jgi:hypothetical protein
MDEEAPLWIGDPNKNALDRSLGEAPVASCEEKFESSAVRPSAA